VRRIIVLFLAIFLVLGAGLASAQKVTLTVALMSSDIPEATQAFLDAFVAENPDIQIDFTSLPDDVEGFLQPKAASGELPDYMSINGGSFGAGLVDKGLILDLRGTFADKNTIDAVKPQFTSPMGKLFGIAGGVSTSVIYYQVKAFKDLGITPPDNWEDFLVACEKLKKAGKTPLIITPADGTIANTLWSWGFANNIVAKYPDYAKRFREGTMPLDTPEFADVFAKAKVLYDKGYTQEGAVSTLYMDGNQMYIQGKAVQQFAGSWLAGSLLKTDFETGIYMPPWNAKGKTKVPIVATETGWAVAEGPHKAQATRLLDWMNGKGFHYYQNARGNIPDLKDPMGPIKLDQRMKTYLDKLYSYKLTSGLWFEFIPAATMQLIPKLYQEVLLGQKTPREAAAAFDKAAKDAVNK
jgi:multiple sugar transport system substrate-binding protein/raffinose/stachyose/melibiose transport system substrate-binding protein